MSFPILTNPPITEALIDIRVKLPSNTDIQALDSLYNSIKIQYPEKQPITISSVTISLGKKKEHRSKPSKIIGYRYISADKKQILQARLDGFTLSRLHPYTNWKELQKEAYSLWQNYKNIVIPEAITRVALRYINNLNITMPIKDFGDYLTAPPVIPKELPQDFGSFLTRIVTHTPHLNADAIIIQALEKITGNVAPVLLDIDVFRFQAEGIEEKDAWELIEELRHLKNKIFFSSLTKTLQEQYK